MSAASRNRSSALRSGSSMRAASRVLGRQARRICGDFIQKCITADRRCHGVTVPGRNPLVPDATVRSVCNSRRKPRRTGARAVHPQAWGMGVGRKPDWVPCRELLRSLSTHLNFFRKNFAQHFFRGRCPCFALTQKPRRGARRRTDARHSLRLRTTTHHP